MKKKRRNKRERLVMVRLTREEIDRFREVSEKQGFTLSGMIRHAANLYVGEK